MTFLYQFVSTAIISFACTTLGIQYALPSSTLKLFRSENTSLDRVMTETEQSLMGSISSASTLLVTPFCGYLLDTFGRKRTLIMFYFPQFLSWLVLVTTLRVEAFILAMFLCGLSGSVLLVAVVYINEFCDPSIRGGMSSSTVIFNGVGVLLSYLFGGLLEYRTISYIGLSLNATVFLLIYFLKESPLYLMKKGYEKEAAHSIAFYKGTKSYSAEVINEMDNIRRLINADVEEIITTPEEEKFRPDDIKLKEKLSIRTFLTLFTCGIFLMLIDTAKLETWAKGKGKSRSSRRALITVLVIFTLTILQGANVVQIFAGPLFEAAVPSITAILTTVLFAIITIIAALIGAYLTDKVGRRILIIVTSIGTGFLCVILATNIQFNWASSVWNAVLIYVYTFTYAVGAGTVPFVLLGEVFLPEIKGFATTLCVEWSCFCNFILFYIFVPLFNAYGLGPLFYFFGGFSFVTAFFSFIYLPETKTLPVDVIQTKFCKI